MSDEKNIHTQKRKDELLEELKEEIFQELDRRISATEKTLSNEITHVEEVIEEKYGDELTSHVERSKKWRSKVHEDLEQIQRKISYYRLPYAALVVAGFMLFWYGAFNLIPKIPYLSDGVTALIAGLVLLIITGAAHRKLVG